VVNHWTTKCAHSSATSRRRIASPTGSVNEVTIAVVLDGMDLTEQQWAILAPLLPPPRVRRDRRSRPWRDPRDVLNGILRILRTGAPWKDQSVRQRSIGSGAVTTWGIDLIARHRDNRRRPPTQDGRPLRRQKRRWKIERLFAWFITPVAWSCAGTDSQRTTSRFSISPVHESYSGIYETTSSRLPLTKLPTQTQKRRCPPTRPAIVETQSKTGKGYLLFFR
jgi:hypothetical protein